MTHRLQVMRYVNSILSPTVITASTLMSDMMMYEWSNKLLVNF